MRVFARTDPRRPFTRPPTARAALRCRCAAPRRTSEAQCLARARVCSPDNSACPSVARCTRALTAPARACRAPIAPRRVYLWGRRRAPAVRATGCASPRGGESGGCAWRSSVRLGASRVRSSRAGGRRGAQHTTLAQHSALVLRRGVPHAAPSGARRASSCEMARSLSVKHYAFSYFYSNFWLIFGKL